MSKKTEGHTQADILAGIEHASTLAKAQNVALFYHELIRLGLTDRAATDLAVTFFVKLVEGG